MGCLCRVQLVSHEAHLRRPVSCPCGPGHPGNLLLLPWAPAQGRHHLLLVVLTAPWLQACCCAVAAHLPLQSGPAVAGEHVCLYNKKCGQKCGVASILSVLYEFEGLMHNKTYPSAHATNPLLTSNTTRHPAHTSALTHLAPLYTPVPCWPRLLPAPLAAWRLPRRRAEDRMMSMMPL